MHSKGTSWKTLVFPPGLPGDDSRDRGSVFSEIHPCIAAAAFWLTAFLARGDATLTLKEGDTHTHTQTEKYKFRKVDKHTQMPFGHPPPCLPGI